MSHWSWNEEEAKKCSAARKRAQGRVKEIFGAVLASAAIGIGPRSVLEIADSGENDKRVPNSRAALEAQKVADILGL
jgi:hypothetical protein